MQNFHAVFLDTFWAIFTPCQLDAFRTDQSGALLFRGGFQCGVSCCRKRQHVAGQLCPHLVLGLTTVFIDRLRASLASARRRLKQVFNLVAFGTHSVQFQRFVRFISGISSAIASASASSIYHHKIRSLFSALHNSPLGLRFEISFQPVRVIIHNRHDTSINSAVVGPITRRRSPFDQRSYKGNTEGNRVKVYSQNQ